VTARLGEGKASVGYVTAHCRLLQSSSLICCVNHSGRTVNLHFFAELYQVLCWLHVIKVI